MECLLFVTMMTSLWLSVVEGTYHELSLQKIKTPNGLGIDALFGYSIAFQSKTKRLIVSAPQANSIGEIFECQNNLICNPIIKKAQNESDLLTNMWLGATVATGSHFTVACAPRSIKIAPDDNYSKNGTFGRCFVSSALGDNTTELKPLLDKDKEENNKMFREHERYMDSFGWAINVDKYDSIIIGGPAMHTGRAILYSNTAAYPRLLKDKRVISPINYNFGYSVTSGQYIPKNITIYAISSPYGRYGKGVVILSTGTVSWYLENTVEYSPPVGSLFGASLCSAKLRGSKQRDALLIGASLYATKDKVDVGAVYIYQYDPARSAADYPRQVVHQKTILGRANRGRFGSALINLGDLNGDKRDEVAISAPYEDEGRGSVYIYSAADILGDEPADKIQYLQKLRPEEYSTFGYSMTAHHIHEGSSCNGLAIGAPGSNAVLLYRCIPKIILRVEKLQDDPRSRGNNTLFHFNSCVYIAYPAKPDVIKAEIAVEITLTHPTARIINGDKDGSMKYTISTLATGKKEVICNAVTIVLPEEGSYEPVIQYQISASQNKSPTQNTFFDDSHAMLSDLSTLSLTDTLWVADCAGDKICDPILTFDVDTSMRNGYVIGSSESEGVIVSVHNSGDPAYTACVDVSVKNVRVRRWPPGCKRVDPNHGTCTPNRPIRNNTSWNTGVIEMETKSLRSDVKEVVLIVDLFEQCSSKTDKKQKSGKISLKTDPIGLVARGYTNLGDMVYLTPVEVDETGKQLSHIYTVANRGVTTWVNIACNIVLDKKPYFKGLVITIDTQATYKCDEDFTDNNGKYYTKCSVSEVKSSEKFDVIISIYIEPKIIDWKTLEQNNMTLSSYITVTYDEKQVTQSIASVLRNKESVVPLWVIIVAALVGLLIMFLIAFALYEIGFLRRKNKEKLDRLKRSVHRQSMRRSTVDRESKRTANQALVLKSDERKLIEESEESEPSSPGSTTEKPLSMPAVKKPPRLAKAEETQGKDDDHPREEKTAAIANHCYDVHPALNQMQKTGMEQPTPVDCEKRKCLALIALTIGAHALQLQRIDKNPGVLLVKQGQASERTHHIGTVEELKQIPNQISQTEQSGTCR